MKIYAVKNNLSFGKTKMTNCWIHDKSDDDIVKASIYKMNPSDKIDLRDVYYSSCAFPLYNDMIKQAKMPVKYRDFYIIKNDSNDEILSCAQVVHKFDDSKPQKLTYSCVEELNHNPKYIDALYPLLRYIEFQAKHRKENQVVVAVNLNDETNDIKKLDYKQKTNGDWYRDVKK